MNSDRNVKLSALALMIICGAIIAASVLLRDRNRNTGPFWEGLTDSSATSSMATYSRFREKLDGAMYAEVVEWFGPGKLIGPTLDERRYIFNWSGQRPYDSGLTIVCSPRGCVVDHYWAMP